MGEINRKAKHSKKHFWATFSDGEYKCPHLDAKDPLASAQKNGYGTHWLLVRARTHACTHARMHAAHMSLQVQAKEDVVHIDGVKITSKRKESEECEDLRQAEETPRDMIVPGGF